MSKDPEILLIVKKRKLEYLGHMTRGQKYRMLQLVYERKVTV